MRREAARAASRGAESVSRRFSHARNPGPRHGACDGTRLAPAVGVPSDALSARVEPLSDRARTIYRWFADVDRGDAALQALWQALARGEEEHQAAQTNGRPQTGDPAPVSSNHVGPSLHEVARRLTAAERLEAHDPLDRRLAAALAIEMARLEVSRRTQGQPGGWRPRPEGDVRALTDLAVQRSRSPRVRLAAAVLLTRHELARERPAGA